MTAVAQNTSASHQTLPNTTSKGAAYPKWAPHKTQPYQFYSGVGVEVIWKWQNEHSADLLCQLVE